MNNCTVAFDFETIANPGMVNALPEPKPNKTLKDPDKIAIDIAFKKKKQVQDMGLNPHTNLICCASFKDVDSGGHGTILYYNGLEYGSFLDQIWDALRPYQIFVTFNGIAFDVEVLKFHSMFHDVPKELTTDISQHKYSLDTNHIDIRMRLGRNNDYAKGTQDYFSRILLGEEPSEFDGSMVQKWWDNQEYDLIKEKCADDVDKLTRIYHKIKDYYI